MKANRDAFIVSLRKSLEDVEAEARRRIRELPDGTYPVNLFSDSTLRENVLLKYPARSPCRETSSSSIGVAQRRRS